jgi:hypothetical protein
MFEILTLKVSLMTPQHSTTKISVKDLKLSEEFSFMCNANNFRFLDEITQCSVDTLLKKPHFTMHMMMELLEVLEKLNIRFEEE